MFRRQWRALAQQGAPTVPAQPLVDVLVAAAALADILLQFPHVTMVSDLGERRQGTRAPVDDSAPFRWRWGLPGRRHAGIRG